MSTYIVSFDIESAEKKSAIIAKLKSYGTYCPINANCWAIVSNSKAAEIRDSLKIGLTADERIFVIRSGTEAAWINSYGTNNNDWLKQHL